MALVDENKNVLTIEKSFDAFFNSSIDGVCELSSPPSPPKWLNKKLYLEGVNFFWDHVLAIFLVLCQNLVVGLSIPNLGSVFLTHKIYFTIWRLTLV